MDLDAVKKRLERWDRVKALPPGNAAPEALRDMENHLEKDLREAIEEIERLRGLMRRRARSPASLRCTKEGP